MLLQSLQSEALTSTVVECLAKGFGSSQYSGLLENMTCDMALTEFSSCPFLSFLESLLSSAAECIGRTRKNLYPAYAELVFSIGKNFSLLFLKASSHCHVELVHISTAVESDL
eukprot:TRINITY_DN22333_c0_g3_i1.p2 TRINITY_DN22333_c0_g3~~TRINITY_DN22333_c0_g3_i1.p2  ORF type:complete len:113 (-),score=14.38 TRINITY_DN22333_c0_g3_i1:601-939(-)